MSGKCKTLSHPSYSTSSAKKPDDGHSIIIITLEAIVKARLVVSISLHGYDARIQRCVIPEAVSAVVPGSRWQSCV